MAAVPPRGFVEHDGGCVRTAYIRYGPVLFLNGCYVPTCINLARRFGSGKVCKRMKGMVVLAWRCAQCGNCEFKYGFKLYSLDICAVSHTTLLWPKITKQTVGTIHSYICIQNLNICGECLNQIRSFVFNFGSLLHACIIIRRMFVQTHGLYISLYMYVCRIVPYGLMLVLTHMPFIH